MVDINIDELIQRCDRDSVYRLCVTFHPFTEERNALLIDHTKSEINVLGSNKCGQLATGNNTPHQSIFKVDVNFDINQINELIEGNACMFATLKTTGIYVWGTNHHGQFGNGLVDVNIAEPQMIAYFRDKKIIKLSVGHNHQVCLDEHGNLYGWGDNYHKQVVKSRETIVKTPTNISVKSLESIKFRDIICMSNTSIAIDDNYKVYIWGLNEWRFFDDRKGTVISSPKIIEINDQVACVACAMDSFYYMNCKDEVFKYNGFRAELYENFYNINCQTDYLLLDEYSSEVLFIKNDQVFYHQKNKLTKVAENLFEYYNREYQATFKTFLIDKMKVKYYKCEDKVGDGLKREWIEIHELEPSSEKFCQEDNGILNKTPLRHSLRLESRQRSETIDRMKAYEIVSPKKKKNRRGQFGQFVHIIK